MDKGTARNQEFRDAAIFGEIEQVREMLSATPQLARETDEDGFTALHEVVVEHSAEMVALLIEAGADVNAGNDEGISPLHLAAYDDIIEILLSNGADIELKSNDGLTPLHVHAENPEGLETMAALLKHGADVHAKSAAGQTPMDVAAARDEQDKVALLRRHGA